MSSAAGTGQSFTLEQTDTGWRLRSSQAAFDWLELVVPSPWQRIVGTSSWALGQVRLQAQAFDVRGLEIQVELENFGDELLLVSAPWLEVWAAQGANAWLAGGCGEVVVTGAKQLGRLRQRVGYCGQVASQAEVGVGLFADPVVLRPGELRRASWEYQSEPVGVIPPEPDWLPETRYAEQDYELALGAAADQLTLPPAVTVVAAEATLVSAPAGIYQVEFLGRGNTRVEIGWHLSLPDLVTQALQAELAPDLEAWLLIAGGGSLAPAMVDRLDALLGEALETPTLWGMLAALRAIEWGLLPLERELQRAADRLAATDPKSEAIPILGLLSRCGGAPRMFEDQQLNAPTGELPKTWRLLSAPDAIGASQILAAIEYGRSSSRPPQYDGRELALAELWLASRPDSAATIELGGAIERSRQRLLCWLSEKLVPQTVAWLLLGHGLR